ncbi:hypothetical protein EU545_01415 [Candidatus Thorarchaeota archaeon]|nr:MAG: hypothetical protein EU545_01415 [Candidatus Thorarchaeota archaeon]
MIRRRKMAQMMKEQEKLQADKDRKERTSEEQERLLKRFLAKDAQEYLKALKAREPAVGERVQGIILYLIVYRGIRQLFSQIDVRYIERQVKGEEPKIRVHRDGETSDFGAYVREAIKKDSDD